MPRVGCRARSEIRSGAHAPGRPALRPGIDGSARVGPHMTLTRRGHMRRGDHHPRAAKLRRGRPGPPARVPADLDDRRRGRICGVPVIAVHAISQNSRLPDVHVIDEDPVVMVDDDHSRRRHRPPAHITTAISPLDPRRGPRSPGDPHPAVRVIPDPAAIMIGGPAPLRVITAPEYPVAVVIDDPVTIGAVWHEIGACHVRRRLPYPAITRVVHPHAVIGERLVEVVDHDVAVVVRVHHDRRLGLSHHDRAGGRRGHDDRAMTVTPEVPRSQSYHYRDQAALPDEIGAHVSLFSDANGDLGWRVGRRMYHEGRGTGTGLQSENLPSG
jgi:hypothetical protein